MITVFFPDNEVPRGENVIFTPGRAPFVFFTTFFVQDYNKGDGATVHYANVCTNTAGTCDPQTLMSNIDAPDSAEVLPVTLETTDADEAVGKASASIFIV